MLVKNNKICIGFVFFLFVFMLCACSQKNTVQAEPYDAQQLAESIEQKVMDADTQVIINYAEEKPVLKEKIPQEIPVLMSNNYLCQNLLEQIQVDYDQQDGYTQVTLTLTYRNADQRPVAIVRTKEDILEKLQSGWKQHFGKVTLLVLDMDVSDEGFFALLDTAEVNSAVIPCEAQRVQFEYFDKTGGMQLVHLWLEFPFGEDVLGEKKEELLDSINRAAQSIESANPSGSKAGYLAVYDYVQSVAQYDAGIAYATQAGRLSDEMLLQRSAYGALVEGKTVCNGYARAYKAICDRLSLPCMAVIGTKDGVKHAWNIIILDGEPLYIDCTPPETARQTPAVLMEKGELRENGYEIDQYMIIPDKFA